MTEQDKYIAQNQKNRNWTFEGTKQEVVKQAEFFGRERFVIAKKKDK